MAQTKEEPTVKQLIKVREKYIEKSTLFGLIKWKEIVSFESMGSKLYVEVGKDITEVIINNQVFKLN